MKRPTRTEDRGKDRPWWEGTLLGDRRPKMSGDAPAVDLEELRSKIAALGDSIKQLKSSSEPDANAIGTAVAALLDAKRTCECPERDSSKSSLSADMLNCFLLLCLSVLCSQLPKTMAGSAWTARSGRSL